MLTSLPLHHSGCFIVVATVVVIDGAIMEMDRVEAFMVAIVALVDRTMVWGRRELHQQISHGSKKHNRGLT